MEMDDRCPICQAGGEEREREVSLKCCKKIICGECLVAWQQNSNLCPLCKTPFQAVEAAKRAALDALLHQIVGANRLLQKLSSLSENSPLSDQDKVSEISSALTDVFDKALKLGFGPPAERADRQLFSRELLSFALAAFVTEGLPDNPLVEISGSRDSDWTDVSDSESSVSDISLDDNDVVVATTL